MPVIPYGQIPQKIRDVLLATLSDLASGRNNRNKTQPDIVIVSPWIRDVPLPVVASSPFASEIPFHFLPPTNHLSDILSSLRKAEAWIRVITLPGQRFRTDLGKSINELSNEATLLSKLKST